MKKFVSAVALSALIASVQPVIASNPSDCNWFDVKCVQDQFNVGDYGSWSPEKGAILYYSSLKKFRIFLFFSSDAIDFYNANPWAGLDIDVIFHDTFNLTFTKVEFDSVESQGDVIALRDTIVESLNKNKATRAITIVNPSKLKVGWNILAFYLKDNFSGAKKITANVQLVANISDSSFAKNLYNHNSYGWYFAWYSKWLAVTAGGLIPSYSFINKPGEDVFKYFSIASALQATRNTDDENTLEISSSTDAEGLCWVDNSNEYARVCHWDDLPTLFNQVPSGDSHNKHDDSSVQEVSLNDASNQIRDGGGISPFGTGYVSSSNINIFTEGYHTHIIHPTDFRCSNNLCWSPSLDTSEPDNQRNCWNADDWYQITNGNYNGSQSYRNRSMCDEVYSDLDKDDDGDGYTENQGDLDDANPTIYPTSDTGDGDDGVNGDLDSDPDISIDSFKLKNTSGGDWEHSVGVNLNWGESFYVKGRLVVCNESQLEAKDIDSDYRIEDNKHFDDDDTKVDEDGAFDLDSDECTEKSMTSIKIQVSSDGQSVTTSGPNGSRTMPVSNNFCKVYFFSDIEEKGRSNGDDDISSESNDKEYGVVRVTVKDPAITANFSTSAITGTAPLDVNFTDSSSGVIKTRSWFFNDGDVSNEVSPTHVFTEPGVYEVTLAISNLDHAESQKATIIVNAPIPEDTDGDGIIDDNETGDTDGDGLADWEESNLSDIDNDGVNDELDSENTNPANDSDDDGYTNEEEVSAGTDPLNPSSFPEVVDSPRADVNGDGYITTADSDLILRYSIGLDMSATNWVDNSITGDVNCDGLTVSTDASFIIQYINGSDMSTADWCALDTNEGVCEETAQTATNGGWGWNYTTEVGCVPESQNFCHSNNDGTIYGWNPYTQTSCELDEDTEDNGNSGNTQNNLVSNFDFSNGWNNWIDATWNVTSTIDIFDNRAVITITDNSNSGDAKLFHDEVSVTAGNYTFGATITNDVEVTAMLYLKKADGSDEWNWAGVISPSAEEQTVTFTKTLSSDVTTARVIMSIKDVGTLGIDDYFLMEE